jgi:hypothetical protein
MDFLSGLKNILKTSVPILSSLIFPGSAMIPIIGSLIGESSVDKMVEKIESDPESLKKIISYEKNNSDEIRKLLIQKEIVDLQEKTKQSEIINETIQSEYNVNNKFKSYWRPLWGYCTAIAWVVQMISIFVVIIFGVFTDNSNFSDIITSISSLFDALVVPWVLALGVLGINIKQRSNDKKTMSGNNTGDNNSILKRVTSIINR